MQVKEKGMRIALVTGANRGIGLESCRQLAERGLHVLLTSRNEAEGRESRETLREQGLPVDYQWLDVSETEQIETIVDLIVKEYGRIDVLINNAGSASMKG